MSTKANRLKWLLVMVVGAGALVSARNASACINDIECPTPACGGDVCNWNRGMTCQPAGTDAKGSDGWCTTTADCKCKDLGATCVLAYCTFTKPSDAPGAATGGATGHSGGATGSTGGTTGSTGGTTGSTGGTTGSTGGTTAGVDAGTTPKDSGGGGCSIGGTSSSSLFGAMAVLGAFLALRRSRSRNRG